MPGSTTSFLFPDINVWIALTWEGHVHHAIARRWFGTVDGGARLFFCRFTQLGLLRLLSSEAVMGVGVSGSLLQVGKSSIGRHDVSVSDQEK